MCIFFVCFPGYALKCNQCFSLKSWDECNNTTEQVSCTEGQDRCVTQEVNSESSGKTAKLFVKGCTTSSLCSLGEKSCRPTDPSAKITKCEVDCCKGDLCIAADSGANNGAQELMVIAIMLLSCTIVVFPS